MQWKWKLKIVSKTYPIVSRQHPMSQYSDKLPTAIPVIRSISRRCRAQSFSQVRRSVGPTPVAFRNRGTEAETEI